MLLYITSADYLEISGCKKIYDGVYSVENGDVYIKATPLSKRLYTHSQIVEKLSVKNNEIIDYPSIFRTVVYRDKSVAIYADCPKYEELEKVDIIAQENLNFTTCGVTVTVYHDDSYKILCETDSNYIGYNLDNLLSSDLTCINSYTDIYISIAPIYGIDYIMLRGIINDRLEHMVIVGFNSEFYLVANLLADDIDILSDRIKTKCYKNDMLGRIVCNEYMLQEHQFCQIHRYFEYLFDDEYHYYLIPYLFIEAILSGDYECAREYLDDSIKNSLEDVISFLGSFSTLACQPFQHMNICEIVLENNVQGYSYAKTYRFEMKNKKIVNILEL